MISLAGMPYVPSHALVASGDWTTAAVIVLVMAIAFGAMAVLSYCTSRPQKTSKREQDESNRKAA